MNRDIKFKAWNKIENEMSYVFQIQYDGVILEVTVEDDDYLWDINDIELLQNTGLKDIRDNEIWEGDIVKWGHLPGGYETPVRIAVVEFKPDIQFRPINLKNNKPFYYGNFAYRDTEKYLEILGNIYDNPELLEDK